MSDVAKLNIPITATNDTDKGAKDAEKRLGAIGKKVADTNRKAMNDNQRATLASTKAIIGSFAKVEQAASRVFGGGSMTAGLAGKIGAVGQAAAAMGNGLAGAAASGNAFAESAGTVATVLGGTVAILGAAAVGAYKLATSWATGAAQIGRTANTIGVSTKALQEFTAAAERAGVSKGAATSAVGGLSETLNDARYGRNAQAGEVLRRLGVTMQLNKDGTVNTGAMLPAIADAISRQNSSGQRTAARYLGIPLEALPAFAQSGKALSADMADADKTANVLSDHQLGVATRIARKGVMIGQIGERVWNQKILGNLAGQGEGAIDGALQAARAMNAAIDGDFKPGASLIHQAAETFSRGVADFVSIFDAKINNAPGRVGGMSAQSHAAHAAGFRDMLMGSYGLTRADATALASSAEMESGLDPNRKEILRGGRTGPGRGLFQITDRKRKMLFQSVMGVPIEAASRDQQIRFAIWELHNSEAGNWKRVEALGSDSQHRAAGYSALIERSANKYGDARDRALVAGMMDKIPIHVTVEVRGSRARAKVEARGAVSHAISN